MNISPISEPSVTLAGITLPLSVAKIYNTYSDDTKYTSFGGVVPVGFKLVCYAAKIIAREAKTSFLTLGYADAAVTNSVSSPSNLTTVHTTIAATSILAGGFCEVPLLMEVPAGKYPVSFTPSGNASVVILAKLVAV